MALTDNLKAYYTLDESSGDCADSTGVTGTATANGTVTSVSGKIVNGRSYTASTQYLSVPITNMGYTNGSINWWQYNNVAYNNNTNVVGVMQQGVFPEFSFQKYLNGSLYFGWNSSGHDDRCVIAASAANWPQSTWTMYTFTWISGGVSELFVNAASVKQFTGSTTVSNLATNILFGVQASVNTLNGYQDELGIWDKVLSGSEITTLYNGGAGLAYPFSTSNPMKAIQIKQAVHRSYSY